MLSIIPLHQVPPKDYRKLVEILKENWGHLNKLTEDHLQDRARRREVSYVAYLDKNPAGILQTKGLKNNDSLFEKDCPEGNYHYVMNLSKVENPIIRVCMDATIAKEYLGQKLGGKIINYALVEVAEKEPSVVQILTYTPKGIGWWHEKNGAELTDLIIKNARPGNKVELVTLTSYTKKMLNYRRKLSK